MKAGRGENGYSATLHITPASSTASTTPNEPSKPMKNRLADKLVPEKEPDTEADAEDSAKAEEAPPETEAEPETEKPAKRAESIFAKAS